ncbi:MAG: tellurite resistance TerB family protein [Hyphomicrobiaceae bacterium]
MNLVGTLAKVAVGVMVARGVGSLMGGGKSSASGQSGGGLGGGGLGGLLGGLAGGGAQQSGGAGGGLGGLLGGLTGGSAQQGGGAGGGLGGLLGGLAGAAGQSSGSGGLGGLLGNLMAGGGQPSGASAGGQGGRQAGSLGGLLDNLGGGRGAGGNSLGGLFDQALAGRTPPEPEPDQNAQAEILLRAMINAAKSDGEIDQAEQAQIVEHLGDVSQDEIAFVRNEMAQPLDVDSFVRSVPQDLKQQVYLMSLLGIKLDSQAEAQYLDRLASGLGISQAQSNDIHEQVGVPPLYA